MVDYTKWPMRDESWRRWKGASKLAKALTAFYTTPSAMKRIAANNAGLSMGAPKANGEVDLVGQRIGVRGNLRNRIDSRQVGRPDLTGKFFTRSSPIAKASPSLPGMTAPKR